MARYIDADALYEKLFPLDLVDKRLYTINAKAVADAIANIPTADVVPKREVFLASSDAMKMLIECHGYALTHDADIKKEVAREIFEEIKQKRNELWNTGKYTMFECWCKAEDEVKKKYIGESDVKRDTV